MSRALTRLALLPHKERARMLERMSDGELRVFNEWWERWAHEGQFWPKGTGGYG